MILLMEKKPKKSGVYFTQDTEDAIVLYNNTPDSELKNNIYQNNNVMNIVIWRDAPLEINRQREV